MEDKKLRALVKNYDSGVLIELLSRAYKGLSQAKKDALDPFLLDYEKASKDEGAPKPLEADYTEDLNEAEHFLKDARKGRYSLRGYESPQNQPRWKRAFKKAYTLLRDFPPKNSGFQRSADLFLDYYSLLMDARKDQTLFPLYREGVWKRGRVVECAGLENQRP